MHFDSYDEFERSQQACLIGVADFYPVVKLTLYVSWVDYQGLTGMFSIQWSKIWPSTKTKGERKMAKAITDATFEAETKEGW